MKDLLTRRGNKTLKITLNERCSAVVLNKIPLNEKDARSFTIPCVIGQSGINKALADLGASISLIAYSMFLRLNLGELKPIRMCIELANKSTQIPKGIAENVIGKIDRFVFPVDFVVLDMKEDHKITIVLGRPLLATTHAMLDVFNKKISFEVGNETITFDLKKSMRFPPSDDDTYLEPESEDYKKPTLFAANMFEGEKATTKLKDLASHLDYAFLDNNQELPVIISSLLSSQEKELLFGVLIKHKSALAWKVVDIQGISPSFCTHKILMEDSFKIVVQPQRRLNPKVQDVVKAEIVKLLDAGLIYAISNSPWDHFPLPFIDQMLERLSRNEYYCFMDGFLGYFQIPLAPEDQEKTNFTCPYGTFAYRRMPFGLCNAPATFQQCMTTIFHDMCKDFMEVFMDDFFVFGNSIDSCLNNLSRMLARCKETNQFLTRRNAILW
ncbi:DNA-directed DNA polymerase [Tanacetum coccineum]